MIQSVQTRGLFFKSRGSEINGGKASEVAAAASAGFSLHASTAPLEMPTLPPASPTPGEVSSCGQRCRERISRLYVICSWSEWGFNWSGLELCQVISRLLQFWQDLAAAELHKILTIASLNLMKLLHRNSTKFRSDSSKLLEPGWRLIHLFCSHYEKHDSWTLTGCASVRPAFSKIFKFIRIS